MPIKWRFEFLSGRAFTRKNVHTCLVPRNYFVVSFHWRKWEPYWYYKQANTSALLIDRLAFLAVPVCTAMHALHVLYIYK